MEFYVYVWRDSAGIPFYVGKGKGRRAYDTYSRSVDFKEIYESGGCAVEIIDWFIHESQAHAFEVELVTKYGRRDLGGTLVNKTNGGEGISGLVRSAETRAKISVAKKGIKKSPLSEECKAKIRASTTGKKRSPETRARMSDALRRRTHSAETRAKLSVLASARRPNAETRARMSASHRMRPGRSGYKGVDFKRKTNLWRARINLGDRVASLGSFSTPEQAALAYDRAAFDAWDRDCYLNFPDEIGGSIAA